jgi:hypothetical protein
MHAEGKEEDRQHQVITRTAMSSTSEHTTTLTILGRSSPLIGIENVASDRPFRRPVTSPIEEEDNDNDVDYGPDSSVGDEANTTQGEMIQDPAHKTKVKQNRKGQQVLEMTRRCHRTKPSLGNQSLST